MTQSVRERFTTHDVQNQPQPLPAYDAWTSDRVLRHWVSHYGGGWAEEALARFGVLAGGENMQHGELANRHRPALRSFDAYGRRLDEVEFHPAYHALMRNAMQHAVHSFSWRQRTGPAPTSRAPRWST